MNGIETILQRLRSNAQTETDGILEKARQEAEDITAHCQAQADREREELTNRYTRMAAEREERLVSAAQAEARKTVLAARQTMVEAAYAQALHRLQGLPRERYAAVLTALLVQAAPDGRGEVIFSVRDQVCVGQAIVDAANDQLRGCLTLSGETVNIPGGFVLRSGKTEVNCAFDVLIRLQRTETAGQVARRLFD